MSLSPITPTSEPQTVALTGGTVKIWSLPAELQQYGLEHFDDMWSLRPKQDCSVLMFGEEVPARRRYTSYMNTPRIPAVLDRSYMFSGLTEAESAALPAVFQPILDHINGDAGLYNQAVVNWYEADEYVPMHMDWDTGLTPDADIVMVTFTCTAADAECRILKLRSSERLGGEGRVDIVTRNGSVVSLPQAVNKIYRHGIKRLADGKAARRIGVTFRSFQA